jgi:cytohesin
VNGSVINLPKTVYAIDAGDVAPKNIKDKNKHAYSMSINCEEERLFDAAARGDLAEVKRLVVDCGVDPNVREDDEGATPLHVAAEYGYSEIVEVLLEHGVDPNIRDKYGATPLHYAAAFDYPKIVELLHKDLSDYDATPLQAAAEFNYREVVKLLLEHGANPNIQENDFGQTPLHDAVSHCHIDVVRVLLDHGADPTIRDNEGRTPLDYGSDCEEITEELRRGGTRTTVYE